MHHTPQVALLVTLLVGPASVHAQATAAKLATGTTRHEPPPQTSMHLEARPPRSPARTRAATAPTPAQAPTTGHDGRNRDEQSGHSVPGQGDTRADCTLGMVCLGPVLDLGVANPLGFGVHTRVGDYLGFGLDYQFLPAIKIESATASASLFTIDARVYPLAGAFFLSAGIAYQTIDAVATAEIDTGQGNTIALAGRGSIGLPMLKLGFGFFGHRGFVLGMDVAVGVPLGDNRVELSATHAGLPDFALAQADIVEAQARDQAQAAVDRVLELMPLLLQVNLLRVGYTF